MSGKPLRIVDTNVLVVANGRSTMSPDCMRRCIDALLAIKENARVGLDEGLEILSEYQMNCAFSGQPGVGDAFFRWVHDNQAVVDRCTMVAITRVSGSRGYAEFPDHPGLRSFDPSDRKFVAVACVCSERPPILQASDSKWVGWRMALSDAGVSVTFVCESELREIHKRKGRARARTRKRRK